MAAATTVPRTNLPTGFYFAGRHRVNPSSTGYQAGKTKSQVRFTPKAQRPLTNGGDKSNQGLDVAGFDPYWGDPDSSNWYPSARPLKQYRLRGSSSSLGTYVSTDDIPGASSHSSDGKEHCRLCPKSNLSIGVPFKMIGKNEEGINKDLPTDATASYDDAGCRVCDPTRGPVLNQLDVGPTHGRGSVMSFSGGAKLKSAVTTVNKNYYQTHSSYMRARGKDYVSNAVVHKVPGIEYNKQTSGGSEIVWPATMQQVVLPSRPS